MLILKNAYFNELFKNDPYIIAHKTKSILCVPIVHKEKFIGAIYLENNLVTQAFSEERVNVMKILSAQIAISLDNALLYRNLEDSLDKQVKLTEAYSRFTPKAYLKFLGHPSILDVKLGDHKIGNMTVLFSDVRSYTTIAEKFTAEENFKFLSNYLEKMTGIVADHNGMVNQLLGDGILAFFDNPENALKAAIEMQLSLQDYVVKAKNGDSIKITVGVGLHSGDVIIGIVGNDQNMDTAILSDTVNAAARIEGLTKHFGAGILLSETTVDSLNENAKKSLRFVARVQMKGKSIPLGIYECFDGEPEQLKNEKKAGYDQYHQALQNYTSGDFKNAYIEFEMLAKKYKNDLLLNYYKEKANSLLNTNSPDNWSAVEVFDVK
jgi:class 3 adenylate cyclase